MGKETGKKKVTHVWRDGFVRFGGCGITRPIKNKKKVLYRTDRKGRVERTHYEHDSRGKAGFLEKRRKVGQKGGGQRVVFSVGRQGLLQTAVEGVQTTW